MSTLVLYGWPITALAIAASGFGYLWWESRRVDRAIARGAAEAETAEREDDRSPRVR